MLDVALASAFAEACCSAAERWAQGRSDRAAEERALVALARAVLLMAGLPADGEPQAVMERAANAVLATIQAACSAAEVLEVVSSSEAP